MDAGDVDDFGDTEEALPKGLRDDEPRPEAPELELELVFEAVLADKVLADALRRLANDLKLPDALELPVED